MTAICSWSGGKDSCLALHRAIDRNRNVSTLFTMMHEEGGFSRSHGTPIKMLEAQAEALGREIVFSSATWENYEQAFIEKLRLLKSSGIDTVVFGDIDLEPHREWEIKVCEKAGLQAVLPLWAESRRALIDEFMAAGFKAVIVSVRDESMGHWLGRVFCEEFIAEAEKIGWDACGEEGEFHTFVFDGPIFKTPIKYQLSEIHRIQNYLLMPLTLTGSSTPCGTMGTSRSHA